MLRVHRGWSNREDILAEVEFLLGLEPWVDTQKGILAWENITAEAQAGECVVEEGWEQQLLGI